MTGCTIADLFDLADQLPEVTRIDSGRYWRIAVRDHTFGRSFATEGIFHLRALVQSWLQAPGAWSTLHQR